MELTDCHSRARGGLASALVVAALACDAGAGEGSSRGPTPGAGRGISRVEDASIPPGPPGVVEVIRRGSIHRVEWPGTRDDTIRGYRILRRCGEVAWEVLAFVPLREDDPRNRGPYHYEDRIDGSCDYTVAAISANNEPGPTSAEIQ